VKRNYHTLDNRGKANERKLVEFLAQNGQQILPMVELITESRMAIDDLVDAMGRATIETVLQLSAEQVAGRPQQGRRRGEGIFWHGKQAGSVYLRERKLKVDKPRLRKKGGGIQAEVAVPAYAAMQDQIGMGSRVLDILMEGVSTRQYGAVIPKMADTVGVSKSSVSRAAIQASEAQLDKLLNRRFDDVDLLVIYVDGMHFGEQCGWSSRSGRTWAKACARVTGGSHRKRGRGEGLARRPGAARSQTGAPAPVRDRWFEGIADCDQCGVR